MFVRKSIRTMIMLALMVLSCFPVSVVSAAFNPQWLEKGDFEYGGELRIGRQTDFPGINPFTGTGAAWFYSTLVYENLISSGPDWKISPWLAKSWEISEDGLTYTFHLYENATWSDGVPLTSEDIKFTFEGWVTHEMNRMIPYVENVDRIDTPDAYTVVFVLKEVDGTFITTKLAWPALCIVPKHIWENFDTWKIEDFTPEIAVGSGPFKFGEWKRGEYLRLVANEDYWMGRPYLDAITYIVIGMRDVQMMAFEKGEIDIFRSIYGNEVPRFLGNPKYKIFQISDVGLPTWYANNRRRPGNDTAFRHAMAYMPDRDKIIDLVLYGYGSKPRHMLAPPAYDLNGWLPPESPLPEQNLTKAAEILDEAGYLDINDDGWREYPDGTQMKLYHSSSDNERYIRIAELLIEDMQSIGINVELEVLEGALWSVKAITSPDVDFTFFRYGPGSSDPREPLSWLTSWGENWVGFYNETYDELFLEARMIADLDELRPLIWDLQRILFEQMPYVPLVNQIYIHVVNVENLAGWSNPPPYGPCTNFQHWNYYNIRLPGPTAAKSTNLAISVASTAMENEPVKIDATLTDDDGDPIENKYVDFLVENVGIGAIRTDSAGKASFNWIPTQAGDYDVKVSFAGDSEYATSASDIKLVSIASKQPEPGPEPEPEPQPDNTMLYLGVVIVFLVAVALIYSRMRK